MFVIPDDTLFLKMSDRSESLEMGIVFRAQSYFYAVKQYNSYGLFMSVLPIFKTGSSVYRMLFHFRFVLNGQEYP